MSVSKKLADNKVTVTFTVSPEAAQQAEKMEVVCDFNNWEAVALKGQKNGSFKGDIKFPKTDKQTYQYTFHYFFADGSDKWDNDWDAEFYQDNGQGGQNSAFSVEGLVEEKKAATKTASKAKTATKPAAKAKPAAKKSVRAKKTAK